MIIDNEQVRKVAHLARLELKSEEEEMFATQLSSILEYFKHLSELDTETVPPGGVMWGFWGQSGGSVV